MKGAGVARVSASATRHWSQRLRFTTRRPYCRRRHCKDRNYLRFCHAAAELSLTAERPALAPLGDPPAMAAANQLTGYDPETLRIVSMDTAQTETPLPTEQEYLQDIIRGGSAPCASSKSAKQLQWRPQNTPRIEKDDIIVVLKPRKTIDLKANFCIIGDDASVGLVVWPVWDQNVLVCALKSVDAAEKLLRDIMLPVGGRQLPFRGHLKLSVSVRKLGGIPVVVLTFVGTKVPRTVLYSYERLPVRLYKKWAIGPMPARDRRPGAAEAAGSRTPVCSALSPLRRRPPNRSSRLCGRFWKPIKPGSPHGSKPKTGHKQVPTPKGGPKKASAVIPEPKKAQTGSPTNVKSGTQARPPVLKAKDFPPLAPVEPAVGGGQSPDLPLPKPPDSSSVSRQTADTVVGSVFTAGHIGRLEALEHTTEQLGERVAALPNQIMSAVRESFLDMFTATLTQTLPEIVAQPWVSTQIKNATRCDSSLLKRKTASRQAAEESGSGAALGGPVQPLIRTAPSPGSSRGFRAWKTRSHLQLYLRSLGDMPALLALQEPGMDAKFSGYSTSQGGPSTCILVNKVYTAVQVNLDFSTEQEYTMVRVLQTPRPVHTYPQHILPPS
ncbi:hypothetical protein HPB49_003287 [Dermacentor silvarum]|uniref:Uncharacterized protein n=1 Tax=Dermacentor silvarum TaxID=543639 RepID=A0ACB8DAF3_DERSI|nr:hypothetical protein HPB49_003287 [Dermacentor silvarum]